MSKRIFHGWYIVAASFLCLVISGGIGWTVFPVVVPSLKQDFGWMDFHIGIAIGLWATVGAVFFPFLGRLIDRFGARWIMMIAVVAGGIVCFAMAEIRELAHMLLVLPFAAITTAASTYVPVTNLMTRWFVRRRGLAMGIAMSGIGLGGFIMPNAASFLFHSMGWRQAYRIFGLVIWVVLLPVIALWVYGRPSDIGLKAEGEMETKPAYSPVEPAAASAGGVSARQAFALPRFWILGFADVANAIPIVSLGLYMVDFSIRAGITASVAALAYSSINAAAIIGTIIAGPAADRFNKRVMISIYYGLPAVAVLFLFRLESAIPLFSFAILAGTCLGGRNAIWPIVINDCFGDRSYSTVMGFLIIFFSVGNIVGPPLAGRISDVTGSFHGVFLLCTAAYLVSGILIAIGAKAQPREMPGAGDTL